MLNKSLEKWTDILINIKDEKLFDQLAIAYFKLCARKSKTLLNIK